MADYNRNRNSRPGGGFRSRPSFGGRSKFGDRSNQGPVETYPAVCDNCGKDCQVPFKPTTGKPIFCSECFDGKRGGDNNRSSNAEDRQMFEAICDECGNRCKVPFRPSGDKPIYCSDCFGNKKGTEYKENRSQPEENGQLQILNSKLDRILELLSVRSNILSEQPEEQIALEEAQVKIKTKPVKKSSQKKGK